MESLMQIANLCQATQILNFVANIADMEILFSNASPSVVQFFQGSFNQTRFTKRVKTLQWNINENQQVIGKKTSDLTEKEVNSLILGR